MRLLTTSALIIFYVFAASSQQPSIQYTLKIDTTDLSRFFITMSVKNISSPFSIAMVAHHEYDDRFWRYVENLQVQAGGKPARIVRQDSSLWKIFAGSKDVLIKYQIHLPATEGQRPAWRPFLSATGTHTGGYHIFFYLPGYEKLPCTLQLQFPEEWVVATELEKVSGNLFRAPSANALADAPILAGDLLQVKFFVNNIPHTISYYRASDLEIDTGLLKKEVAAIVSEAAKLFNGLPYPHYDFLFQDGAYGAMEHTNSVSLGAPATMLKDDRAPVLEEIAHEYFHSWNLQRIRPAEYGDVVYKNPPMPGTLWFSEGFTMYYADLLLRRAAIRTSDTDRIKHLEGLLERYWSNPGNHELSPEKVSVASNAAPGSLGNFTASTHLQGELIGGLLDIKIRNATNGKRSLDDVMRKMMTAYSQKGFTGKDVEKTVSEVCHCDIAQFFKAHVRGSKPLPFKSFLSLIGLSPQLEEKPATNEKGSSLPDLGIYAWPAGNVLLVGITNPNNCWAKAGLNTGDTLLSLNGKPLENQRDFFRKIRSVLYGDTVAVQTKKGGTAISRKVIVGGYNRTIVHLVEISPLSMKQKILKKQWLKGE
jgi:predicted metalloprotease with PDZ domain